jgi:hypothetical protein
VEPVARETLEKNHLYGFKFEQIELGQIPPRITGVKVYDVKTRNEIMMDIDFKVGARNAITESFVGRKDHQTVCTYTLFTFLVRRRH